MAGIDAPFLTPEQLGVNAPGNAALGGVEQTFDPTNKQPLQGIQDTFNRIDTESAQKATQQRQFNHDLLTKHMEYDHEEKMQKAAQAIKDRNDLFNMLSQSGGTSATLKDAQGNDASIPFLPADQAQLDQATTDFNKKVVKDPTGFKTDPESWKQLNELKQTRINASMRSIYTAQAKQQLANTFDPAEKQRLQGYIDKIQSQPLDAKTMPTPFIQEPTVEPMVDASKYKDAKTRESFDEGEGVPNKEYQGLINTTDPHKINEGFKRYQFFQAQPQGQTAEAYQKYTDDLNALTDKRGLPRINLGGTPTQDGKVVFDDGTYAKKQQLAKNYLAASELMNNGHLINPDEEDAVKLEKLKAETREANAKAKKEEIELKTGKSTKPTAEEMKQEESKTAVAAAASEVKGVFADAFSKPIAKVDYPSYYKKNGVDPSEYKVYPDIPVSVAQKYIGIAAPETDIETKDASGNKMTTKSTGGSLKPDRIVPIENKKTGQRELLYWKDDAIKARVTDKQAIVNKIKHETNYDEKLYGQQTPYVDEVYGSSKVNSPVNPVSTPISKIKPANIPAEAVLKTTKDGTKIYVDKKNKKIYDATTGEEVAIN